MNNHIRNRLIGILCILLMIAIAFPYIIRENAFKPNPTISLMTKSETEDYHDFILNSGKTQGYSPNLESGYVPPPMTAPQYTDTNRNKEAASHSNRSMTSAQNSGDKLYYIQLAALKNKQKIEELIALLRLHNYDVLIDTQTKGNEQLYRLLVGPYSSKEQTELAVLDLKNLTKLDGFILSR